jgi:hypothetical protein
MKRFSRVLGGAALFGALAGGVQALTASPSQAQERSCELVWSWQQGMWVCADGPP